MTPVAIIGGGISGVAAAWQLTQLGVPFTLFEASGRLGGTVQTMRRDGFTFDLGPDGWITEKPWATQLAQDLGLAGELIHSNDSTRVTYILRDDALVPMPDGMRMMVPTNLAALHASPLFSPAAIAAYEAEPHRAAELKSHALQQTEDESIAAFTLRHFGPEVLETIAAPLLSGIFGGDVHFLSVRAIMPQFVHMAREHGSLITALRTRAAAPPKPIFTSLAAGTQSLLDPMIAALPPTSIHLQTPVASLTHTSEGWRIHNHEAPFAHVILALPAHATAALLHPHNPPAAHLLRLQESSAIIAAFAFAHDFPLPQGFGFLVPPGSSSTLLAATFADQKYPHRVPPGGRLLRAFFGGSAEPANDRRTDAQLAAQSFAELENILGPLPPPAFHIIRRWPNSLPQYAVGHLTRMAELATQMQSHPTLHLLGNPYRGVGLPDLIRDARALAHWLNAKLSASSQGPPR